jgi:DNA repair exonuclease SbcCD ATPase subunit
MHEVNESTYKRNLYRLEEQMKQRAEKIRQLEKELAQEREEKARLAELAYEVHVIDDEDTFLCPVCRGTLATRHREDCAYALAMNILQPKTEAV